MTEPTTIVPADDERRLPPQERLWISDAELIRWLGLPEKKARQALRQLDSR